MKEKLLKLKELNRSELLEKSSELIKELSEVNRLIGEDDNKLSIYESVKLISYDNYKIEYEFLGCQCDVTNITYHPYTDMLELRRLDELLELHGHKRSRYYVSRMDNSSTILKFPVVVIENNSYRTIANVDYDIMTDRFTSDAGNDNLELTEFIKDVIKHHKHELNDEVINDLNNPKYYDIASGAVFKWHFSDHHIEYNTHKKSIDVKKDSDVDVNSREVIKFIEDKLVEWSLEHGLFYPRIHVLGESEVLITSNNKDDIKLKVIKDARYEFDIAIYENGDSIRLSKSLIDRIKIKLGW